MTAEQTKNMHSKKTITEAVLKARQNRKYTYNYKYQVFDTNENLLGEFNSLKELINYSNSSECNWPLVPTKGKERFGIKLYPDKVCIHATEGTPYKGLYFRRASK